MVTLSTQRRRWPLRQGAPCRAQPAPWKKLLDTGRQRLAVLRPSLSHGKAKATGGKHQGKMMDRAMDTDKDGKLVR